MFFVAHTHILPASLYTSFPALTHILDAMLETSFLAHTQGGKMLCFEEALPCKTQWNVTRGLQNLRGFQGAILT